MAIGLAPAAARAETVVLETAALRLELTTEPYGYRVLEKATGEVLLVHSATTFIAAGEPAPAPDAGSADGGSSGCRRGRAGRRRATAAAPRM